MKKKNAPAITYTEILVRAYDSIYKELDEWQVRIERAGLDQASFFMPADLKVKLDAISTLYKLETGSELER